MKEVMNVLVIALLAITALFQTLRLIYLGFEPKFLEGSAFAKPPRKTMLMLYALLTILTCVYGISIRTGH